MNMKDSGGNQVQGAEQQPTTATATVSVDQQPTPSTTVTVDQQHTPSTTVTLPPPPSTHSIRNTPMEAAETRDQMHPQHQAEPEEPTTAEAAVGGGGLLEDAHVLASPNPSRNADHDDGGDLYRGRKEEERSNRLQNEFKGGRGVGGAERAKQLEDGFYEIEAVRRRRVRKGQRQYLIKWRGWPETANTWEPLENLLSCSDVIDAFEESLRLGKNRKRKRKPTVSQIQPRKRQRPILSGSAAATDVEVRSIRGSSALLNKSSVKSLHVAPECNGPFDHDVQDQGGNDVNSIDTVDQSNGNGFNELDTKLIVLKGAMSTEDADTAKFAVQLQETRAPEGLCTVDGLSKADHVEPVQTNRCTGARRRKSGSVKRFKQESASFGPNDSQNATGRNTVVPCGSIEHLGMQRTDLRGYDLACKSMFDDPRNSFSITKIIKPTSYSASISENVQVVTVKFLVMRSDGEEVTVDNQYLKANNPQLLINFYEQHLRYSTTS